MYYFRHTILLLACLFIAMLTLHTHRVQSQLSNRDRVVARANTTNTQPAGLFEHFSAITTNGTHACALTSNGTAYCWGYNGDGQLGNNTTTHQSQPQHVSMPAGVSVVAIATGMAHTCALSHSGMAYCWGNNLFGQLGDGTTTSRKTPTLVVMPNGVTFSSISTGLNHTCALTVNGSAYCWGRGFEGQLGNNSTESLQSTPVAVSMPTNTTFLAIKSGWNYTCALAKNGRIYCWGDNTYGQLGDGTSQGFGGSVQAVAAGEYHSVALKKDGTVAVWGTNNNGALDLPAGLTGVTQIASRNNFTVALKNDGTVVAWGDIPNAPSNLSGVIKVAAGRLHAVALKSDHTVVVWGDNTQGQKGVPDNLTDVTDIVAGRNHTLALKSNGTVVAWGDNTSGQTTVPNGLSDVVSIAAGEYHSLALKGDGTVVGWGANDLNQRDPFQWEDIDHDGLYDGDNLNTGGINESEARDLSDVIKIVAGSNHSVALKRNGTVAVWGGGFSTNAGCTNTSCRMFSPSILANLSGVVDIVAGYNQTIAFKNDGTAVSWGAVGTDTMIQYPLGQVKAAIGKLHTLVAQSNGNVFQRAVCDLFTCGSDGVPLPLIRSRPQQVQMPADTTYTSLNTESFGTHMCAMTSTGIAHCWGYNQSGQIGNGTSLNSQLSPIAVTMPADTVFSSISSSQNHTCANTTNGTIYCWGQNLDGQLGDGTTTDRLIPVAISTPQNITFASVSTGKEATCALSIAGDAYCWGANTYGLIGNNVSSPCITKSGSYSCPVAIQMPLVPTATPTYTPSNTPTITPTPTRSHTASRTFTITATHSRTRTATNTHTRTNTRTNTTTPTNTRTATKTFTASNTSTSTNTPTNTRTKTTTSTSTSTRTATRSSTSTNTRTATRTPTATPIPFTKINAGGSHTCGQRSTGFTQCWGGNTFGQLGNGNTSSQSVPAIVIIPTSVTQFTTTSLGGHHTCALSNMGTPYCWGRNDVGQLGDGTTNNQVGPIPVTMPTEIPTFSYIATGDSHNCALTSEGKAYCWGFNTSGQLGNGTTNNQSLPVAVTMPSNVSFVAIDASAAHTCALSNNGTVYCWGFNENGQLGIGTLIDQTTPVAITMPSNTTFSAINTGYNHTCALSTTNKVYCWGRNNVGQIGDGSTITRLIPKQITLPVSSITSISVGVFHTCALASNGAAYCWGQNSDGQLGDNTTNNRISPKAVSMPAKTSFTAITTGYFHTCALTIDGYVYCWGSNVNGQIGDGSNFNRLTPTPVRLN